MEGSTRCATLENRKRWSNPRASLSNQGKLEWLANNEQDPDVGITPTDVH
jgi:hypothetical protein